VRCRIQKIPELGDKFATRHAQKGTIGMIYPQEDLPFTADGITPDIIINPHCMPTRMTVGHFNEQLASKLAAITGRQIDSTSFDHEPVETFCRELKAAGFSPYGKEQLYSGRTGLPLKARVFIGPLYYQKLRHMSSDKLHARPRGKIVGLTRQPNEGRANGGGLRWGEMERDVGISYGSSAVLNERMLLSSDAYNAPICGKCGMIGGMTSIGGGRVYQCKACNVPDTIKSVVMPYASKLLLQELMSMGIRPKLSVKEIIENSTPD
jgi:DNA-directed RNA polymerase II subunit RPB2